MDTSTAFLILLACSPDSSHCREMRHSQTYASVEECRESMPDTLRRLSRTGRPAIGRCVSTGQAIDLTTTASIESEPETASVASEPEMEAQQVIVNVTRFENGRPVVTIYNVPKAPADSDFE
jgi:hypothetical protein